MESKKSLETLLKVLDKLPPENWKELSSGIRNSEKGVVLTFYSQKDVCQTYLVTLNIPNGNSAEFKINCPLFPIFGWAVEMEVWKRLNEIESAINREKEKRHEKSAILNDAIKCFEDKTEN